MQFENRIFENETVHLDGNSFRNCEFWGCKLVYNGGPLEIDNLAGKDIELQLTGPARAGQAVYSKLQAVAAAAAPVGTVMIIGESRFRKIDDKPVDAYLGEAEGQ